VGYRHSREEMLTAAVEVARADGLAALSFGRVARRLRISDRTVVYYFPTKSDLIVAVVSKLGAQLQAVLQEAFGDDRLSERDLLRRSWPVLASSQADPLFAVFFQSVGLATAGVDPYPALVARLIDDWAAWLSPRIDLGDVHDASDELRRVIALALMAQLDGLLLLRHTAGPETAEDAARRLGFH
jgi:AcrR family transcriptional regulator